MLLFGTNEMRQISFNDAAKKDQWLSAIQYELKNASVIQERKETS